MVLLALIYAPSDNVRYILYRCRTFTSSDIPAIIGWLYWVVSFIPWIVVSSMVCLAFSLKNVFGCEYCMVSWYRCSDVDLILFPVCIVIWLV